MPTESLTTATDGLCSNPTCQAPITDDNRIAGRRICRSCWRAQKRKNAQDRRAQLAETDPTLKSRKKAAFLDELLRNGGFVQKAINAVGTSRKFVNEEYNSDPDFQLLWDTIVELGNEQIEAEIYRRAVTGHDQPKFYQGKPTGAVERVWSDNLIMFLAKARMPQKYRDLPQKGSEMSDEELNNALQKLIEKRVGRGKAVPVIDGKTGELSA